MKDEFVDLHTGEMINILEVSSIEKGNGVMNLQTNEIEFKWILITKTKRKFYFESFNKKDMEDLNRIKFLMKGGYNL